MAIRHRGAAGWRGNGGAAAVALACALSAAAAQGQPAASGGANAAQQAAAAELRYYRIAPGALGQVLNRFAREAGLTLSYGADLGRDRQSPGLDGRYTVTQALDTLLAGSGLRAHLTAPGRYTLRAAPAGVSALEPVVTRGRRDLSDQPYETSGSVYVVTREQIDRLPPRNTSDVLADIPGVMTANDRQNPGVRINIRGLEGMGRVNATIDGARQNYQQSGHAGGSFVYLDPELLSGVDVTLGPSSRVGGAGVVGGTVNFRTLEASDLLHGDRQVGGRVSVTSGSNAYHFAGSAAVGVRITPDLDLAAAVSRKRVGAYRVGEHGDPGINIRPGMEDQSFTNQSQQSGLFKLGWRPTANQTLKFGYVTYRADFTATSSVTDDDSSIKADTVTLNHTWDPDSPWWNLKTGIWFTRTTNDLVRPESTLLAATAFDIHYQTSTAGFNVSNESRLPLGERADVTLNYGVEFFRDWTDPQASAQVEGVGDPVWFTGATPKGKREVGSVFLDSLWKAGEHWELEAGLRRDSYRLSGNGSVFAGYMASGATAYRPFEVNRHNAKLSPRLTLTALPAPGWRVYLSHSQGMRPPHLTEILMTGSHPGAFTFPYLPNPGLVEERARNWELGASLMLDDWFRQGDKFRVKLAGFHNKLDNYIMAGQIMLPTEIEPSGMRYSNVNILNPVRFYGLEFQTEYDSDRFFFLGSLSYTRHDLGDGNYDPLPLGTVVVDPDTGALGNVNGLLLDSVPPKLRYTISGGVRMLERRLELGVRMRGVGANAQENAQSINVLWQGNYRVFDAWAAWRPLPYLQLRLSVQNLTNRRYREAMSSQSGHLSPGRTVLGTVTLNF